jgi:hypothetical protein
LKRILGIALGVALAGSASAQEFMCGAAACVNLAGDAIFNSPITGIDNLVVDGKTYDMAFSTTMSSPFSARSSTGVDAAKAIDAFFAVQTPFFEPGPGISISINGQAGFSNAIQTAEYLTRRNNLYLDLAPVFWSANVSPEVFKLGGPERCIGTCTTWTLVAPTAAPELDSASLVGALTLLFGGITAMRGTNRRSERVPRVV